MATQIEPLFALKLLLRNSVRARSQLVVEGAEELLNQGMAVLAI